MSDRLRAVGLWCLVAAGAYWCLRVHAARTAMATSEAIAADSVDGTVRPAQDAAARLDVAVRALPERVDALDEKVRRLRKDRDDARDRLAGAWWDARTAPAPRADAPHLVTASVDGGDLGDVEALAKRAVDDVHGVTVVVGSSTFAVAAGERASQDCPAAAIASELSAPEAGAGGDDRLATGANPDLDAADDRIVRAVDRRWPIR